MWHDILLKRTVPPGYGALGPMDSHHCPQALWAMVLFSASCCQGSQVKSCAIKAQALTLLLFVAGPNATVSATRKRHRSKSIPGNSTVTGEPLREKLTPVRFDSSMDPVRTGGDR